MSDLSIVGPAFLAWIQVTYFNCSTRLCMSLKNPLSGIDTLNPNAEYTIAEEHNIQKRAYYLAGTSLVVCSVLALALALHHPEIHTASREFSEFQSQFASIQSGSAWVHGLLIVMLVVFTNGQYWLRKAHGEYRFLAVLGTGFYASGALSASLAAATSGFILPDFIAGIDATDSVSTAMGELIIRMLNDVRDVFHHFSTAAVTIGILCLACALFAERRKTGTMLSGIALAVSSLTGIALVTHHIPPTVHGVTAFAIFLTLWNLLAAIILIRHANSIGVTK